MGLRVQMCLHNLFLDLCRKIFHKVDSMEYKKSVQIPIEILKYMYCIWLFFVFISKEKGLIHIMIFVQVYLKDYYFSRKYISYFFQPFFLKENFKSESKYIF